MQKWGFSLLREGFIFMKDLVSPESFCTLIELRPL